MKLSRRSLALLLSVLLLEACERGKSALPVDSAAVRPAGAADTAGGASPRSWDPSAGPVLLVSGESPTDAYMIVPDSASGDVTLAALPRPASVTLLSRNGTLQTAELPSAPTGVGACLVTSLTASPPPHPWNVGFIGGVVSPLPTDSLESISQADSSALVVWMNRLASALPNDSAGRFTGLPFVVRALWRVAPTGGPQIVIGSLDRRLNLEATPLQEHTFIIAERSASDSSYVTVYSERAYGAEETIQNQDVLATAALGPDRNVALIVARDFGDSMAYGLIQRAANGTWRQRWISARRRC
jgi:hypothetical protein